MAAYTFLAMNGLELEAPEPEAVDRMLGLASGTLSRQDFAAWLRERTVPA